MWSFPHLAQTFKKRKNVQVPEDKVQKRKREVSKHMGKKVIEIRMTKKTGISASYLDDD